MELIKLRSKFLDDRNVFVVGGLVFQQLYCIGIDLFFFRAVAEQWLGQKNNALVLIS